MQFNFFIPARLLLAVGLAAWSGVVLSAQTVASVDEVERIALADEPGSEAELAMASAMREEAVRQGQLPDPELSFGLESVPAGEFALDREPMTQVRLGIMQRFPGGDSLGLRRAALEGRGAEYEARAGLRAAQVVLAVREAWIEWCYWLAAERLTMQRAQLLAQMRDALTASFGAGDGAQQELLGAELELRRTEELRALNAEQSARQWTAIERWSGGALVPADGASWPRWDDAGALRDLAAEAVNARLLQHPEVRALDHRIASRAHGMELARQSYKPSWSLSLGYGARDGEEMDGKPLDDLYSAMVAVELPLFPRNRQDREVQASVYRHEASLAERSEMLRALRAQLLAEQAALVQLDKRLELFSRDLTPLAQTRADAARSDYEAGRGTMQQLLAAQDTQLDLQLDQQRLLADRLRAIARLKYLLPDTAGGLAP